MLTIQETIKQIQDTANENQINDLIRVQSVPIMKVGQAYRQGDLYIFRVADDHPVGEKLDRRQLAEGESIGARHVLLGDFTMYRGTTPPPNVNSIHARVCLGHAFDVTGECTNAHPEHSHFVLPKGRYQVWHQVDLRTLDRAAD